MNQFFKNLMERARISARRPQRLPERHYRLRMEQLEDRMALSCLFPLNPDFPHNPGIPAGGASATTAVLFPHNPGSSLFPHNPS